MNMLYTFEKINKNDKLGNRKHKPQGRTKIRL